MAALDIYYEVHRTKTGYFSHVISYNPERSRYRDLYTSPEFDEEEMAKVAAKRWAKQNGEVAIPVEQPVPVRG